MGKFKIPYLVRVRKYAQSELNKIAEPDFMGSASSKRTPKSWFCKDIIVAESPEAAARFMANRIFEDKPYESVNILSPNEEDPAMLIRFWGTGIENTEDYVFYNIRVE